MSEQRPYWIGGAKDGQFSCQLVPLNMNGEPLSTKQLHEIIVSQSMKIDACLTTIGEMVNALKEMKAWLDDSQYTIAPTVANNLKAIIARVLG